MDLEFALDKKVETDLWNVAFKNVIDSYQGTSLYDHAVMTVHLIDPLDQPTNQLVNQPIQNISYEFQTPSYSSRH